jgi:penicillin amidase
MNRRSITFITIFTIILLSVLFSKYLNTYKKDGTIRFSKLSKTVIIKRDDQGTPYIYGKSINDLIRAQGFAAAQDRLFQMHLTKLFASGRISEMVGEKGLKSDIKMRTLGFARNAKKHLKILDQESLNYLKHYTSGVNRFIRDRKPNHHFEFKLAGIDPELWRAEDTMTILYYMGWGSAANLKTELIAAAIIDKVGLKTTMDFMSLSQGANIAKYAGTDYSSFNNFNGLFTDENYGLGSNSWITGSKKSAKGKPILSNDPHLDSRMLPGPWYPSVLISDKVRVAGVSLAGVPGVIIGRNRWVTCGITNSYGDAQDLYIEKVNPLNSLEYLEGQNAIPFKTVDEKIKIKDGSSYKIKNIQVRLTKRGPVISDIFKGFENKVVTVRWAPYESMGKSLGLDYLIKAKTMDGVRKILKSVSIINLNILIADKNGNIGFQTTGKIPIRTKNEGSLPQKVLNGKDNWKGWIPFNEMPHEINSKLDWIGNANHKTTDRGYPYYYSSYYSPYYRYLRIKELLSSPGKKSADDHYRFQHDTHNIMARRVTPVFCSALLLYPETQEIGQILNDWDFEDRKNSRASAIFHELYKNLANLVFQDELGPKTTNKMLNVWYFWQEKFESMILSGKSKWFDNTLTNKKETLEQLIQNAGVETILNLTKRFGKDMDGWKWGKMHTISFTNPLARKGFFKDILGSGKIEYSGSVDTLQRGYHHFNKSYKTIISSSMRMVSDLSDDDKILLVLAGGVTGRTFSNHMKDQIEPLVNGEKRYLFFSDPLITKNTKNTLILIP